MQPIRVPRPPKEAFNKDRPVSDLIRSQVEHFRHVENKLSPEQRNALPQGYIRTEHEAAQYVSAMTQLLLSQPAPAVQPQRGPIVMSSRARPLPGRVASLVAAPEEHLPATPKKTAPRSRKTKKRKKE